MYIVLTLYKNAMRHHSTKVLVQLIYSCNKRNVFVVLFDKKVFFKVHQMTQKFKWLNRSVKLQRKIHFFFNLKFQRFFFFGISPNNPYFEMFCVTLSTLFYYSLLFFKHVSAAPTSHSITSTAAECDLIFYLTALLIRLRRRQ